MSEAGQRKEISVTGIIATVLVTVGFVWAALQWHNRDSYAQLQASDMQSNELLAFSNLQLISQAQTKYRESDWDSDGKKTYAKYFVHLWTTLNAAGDPIRIELIPRKLAFAMEAAKAIDGYYFIDLHDRMSPQAGRQVPTNYEKEWAILGVPMSSGQTGMLNFLADNSGNIYVNWAKYIAPQYPADPLASGWTKITTPAQLKDFQKKLTYPKDSLRR
jgi:hypothetical protein